MLNFSGNSTGMFTLARARPSLSTRVAWGGVVLGLYPRDLLLQLLTLGRQLVHLQLQRPKPPTGLFGTLADGERRHLCPAQLHLLGEVPVLRGLGAVVVLDPSGGGEAARVFCEERGLADLVARLPVGFGRLVGECARAREVCVQLVHRLRELR